MIEEVDKLKLKIMANKTIKTFFGLQLKVISIRKQCTTPVRYLSNIKAADLVVNTTNSPKPKPNVDPNELVFGQHMADHMLLIEWSSKTGWKRPNILPFGSIPIQPSASVLHYGLEVFEGLKAYRFDDGTVSMFRPDQNMQRLYNSAKRLSLPTFDRDELLKCVSELIRIDQDWIPDADNCSLYVRPTIIATEPSLGVKPPDSAMLFVITGPVGPYFSTGTFQPVSLLADASFVRAWPGGIGDCKAGGNYGPTIYALKLAQSKGCSQCLWLYKNQVTEVGTMNFFMYWINDAGEEELITPPLNGLILPGITRKSLLELAREWDEFKVTEKSFTIQDLAKAAEEGRVKEIFGAGTACVVCPIDQILYEDKYINIEAAHTIGFPVAKRFYDELTDIQYGRKHHAWNYHVAKQNMKKVDPQTFQ